MKHYALKTYSSPTEGDTFVEVGCDVCGAAGGEEVLVTGDYRFVRCRGCGVVYQDPQPTFESLQKRYGADYFSYEIENERNFFRLMLLGLRDVGFEHLPGVERRGRFLDVGCATGMLLAHMRERGWNAEGVELCSESARYGVEKRGLRIHVGTLEQTHFPPDSFNVIHFSHLLEHVQHPRGFLLEVRRILDPQGYAVITTPNIDGLQARLFGTTWRSAIADHLYLFSKRTLGGLLDTLGFDVLAVKTWGGIAQGRAPGLIKRPLDRLAKWWGFGDVMLFLVRKRGYRSMLISLSNLMS